MDNLIEQHIIPPDFARELEEQFRTHISDSKALEQEESKNNEQQK